MESLDNLLPENKFDCSTVRQLRALSDEEIRPLCHRLLEWIQDGNWPVAKELLPVLAQHQEMIIPQLMELLSPEEKDEDWKFSILTGLLPLFNGENLKPLLPLLKRIACSPTEEEQYAAVDEAAKVLLQKRAASML